MQERAAGFARSEADREHANAPLDRVRHGVERLDPSVARAVGQQHDDVRHVAAGAGRRRRAGGGPSSGASPTGGTFGFASAIASIPFSIAAPMAVPRPVVRDVDRVDERLAVGRRRNAQLREAGEDDEGHPYVLRLVLDELAGGVLRNGQPVGLDVGRAHRPRDVECEDDRRARVRDAAFHVWATGGERERDEAREQQGDGKVPLPPVASRQHRAQQARRSSSERPASAAGAAATSTHRGARGQRAARAARAARRTTTQITRPNHAIESTEPSARRSPPAAANSAVTSRGSSTRLNSRSIDS